MNNFCVVKQELSLKAFLKLMNGIGPQTTPEDACQTLICNVYGWRSFCVAGQNVKIELNTELFQLNDQESHAKISVFCCTNSGSDPFFETELELYLNKTAFNYVDTGMGNHVSISDTKDWIIKNLLPDSIADTIYAVDCVGWVWYPYINPMPVAAALSEKDSD